MIDDKTHERWLSVAADLALESLREGGGPFGAVIVKDGEVIGRGKNRVTLWNDPTAHAEVTAIREAARTLGSFFLEGCNLYSSCEPCPMCLGAVYWARVAAVYYASTRHDAAQAGFSDAFIYAEIALPTQKRYIPFYRLENAAADKVFEAWKNLPNRTEY